MNAIARYEKLIAAVVWQIDNVNILIIDNKYDNVDNSRLLLQTVVVLSIVVVVFVAVSSAVLE